MSLWSDFLGPRTRRVHKWTHYFPVYERHLARYVNRPVLVFEIGCGDGGSAQMWKRYLGPGARIVGIDVDPRVREYAEDQIVIRIGDQADTVFLQSLIDEFGSPGIVIDDGGHHMHQLIATFRFLYPQVISDGLYIAEDLHTAYWDEYGGGLRRDGSFMELCKHLVDELNADHVRDGMTPTAFTRQTMSMHFYDSMVVFERGLIEKKPLRL